MSAEYECYYTPPHSLQFNTSLGMFLELNMVLMTNRKEDDSSDSSLGFGQTPGMRR